MSADVSLPLTYCTTDRPTHIVSGVVVGPDVSQFSDELEFAVETGPVQRRAALTQPLVHIHLAGSHAMEWVLGAARGGGIGGLDRPLAAKCEGHWRRNHRMPSGE